MNSSAINFFKYCPVCAGRFKRITRHGRRHLICRQCDFVFYQNSKPTVSAVFRDAKGRVLLCKRAIKPKLGWWDLPGGFLEEGEHPETGLKRELWEELNVRVTAGKLIGMYIDVYSDGYRVYTLNVAYAVDRPRTKMRPQDDVAELCWFRPEDIPWQRLAFPWLREVLHDCLYPHKRKAR